MNGGLLNQGRKNIWLDLIDKIVNVITVILIAFFVLVIIAYLFIRPYEIKGNSMADTVKDGETVIITSTGSNAGYGDIVIIDVTVDDSVIINKNESFIIKRVVGLGGDKIGFVYSSDKSEYFLYRDSGNGWEKVTEPYVNKMTRVSNMFTSISVCNNESELDENCVTIKDGYIFVLGDNRDVSADSRKFGQFTVGSIKGKYLFTLQENGILETFVSLIFNKEDYSN